MGTCFEAAAEGSWSQLGIAELVKTRKQNQKYVIERVKLELGEVQVVAGLWEMSFECWVKVEQQQHWLQRVKLMEFAF